MSGQPELPNASEPVQPKLLDRAWRSYLRAVIPLNAGVNQVTETRRAFYAGAAALYSAIMLGLDAREDATPGDLAMLESIDQELRDHANDVRDGRR